MPKPVSITYVVKKFMEQVEKVADDEDWAESDGWLGKMVITRGPAGEEEFVYEIKDGKMSLAASEGPFTAVMKMSEKTFLDIIDAALGGKGEEMFMRKYAARHVAYDGAFWVVDSERFRKVFRRLAAANVKVAL
jgi:hypothetical protein